MRVTLEQAIAKLQQGEVVAIPTETVYGLAGDARNDDALRQIYATKQRPADNPLIVHIASANQVKDWADAFPSLAQKLADAFWPGPLTLVLKAKPEVSMIVRAGEPTVALRVPAHPLTLQLLQQSGLSLAAPSANKYTQISPTTPEHVERGLGEQIAVLDGGACQVGIESTIVSVEGEDWQLLRHGMISAERRLKQLPVKPALAKFSKKRPKRLASTCCTTRPEPQRNYFTQRSRAD
jgi:L-threonylcarbamoyladenylate synthase